MPRTIMVTRGTTSLWTGSTITASSASYADVNSAVASASNGDIVVIPNGSVTWDSTLTLTKQILLRAKNVGSLTITHGNFQGALIDVTTGSSFHTCIFGISFLPGSAPSGNDTTRYLNFTGSGTKIWMVGKCRFNIPHFQLTNALRTECLYGGLMWGWGHNSTTVGYSEDTQGDGSAGSGSGSFQLRSTYAWDTASTMGSADTNGDRNIYFEDCNFYNLGQCPDVDDNARFVARNCDFDGTGGTTHGCTSAEGGRSVEFYDCFFYVSHNNRNHRRHWWSRAGTVVITGCDIDLTNPYGSVTTLQLCVENAQRQGAWPCADGSFPVEGPTSHYHMIGYGHNGTSHVLDPNYMWSNTGNGATDWSMNDGDTSQGSCGTSWSTSDFVFTSGGNQNMYSNTAKPGYSKFQYPHPLRPTLADSV